MNMRWIDIHKFLLALPQSRLESSDWPDVGEQPARGDGPKPEEEGSQSENLIVGGHRPLVRMRNTKQGVALHSKVDESEGNEDHLDVEIRVRQFRRGVRYQQNRSGH